jgi:hypothetical protein
MWQLTSQSRPNLPRFLCQCPCGGIQVSERDTHFFLKAYGSPAEARGGIGAWLTFYNDERPHQTHGYRTPREVFTGVAHGYVDNVSTLTTYPQAQQLQEKAFINSNIKVSIASVTPWRAGDREMDRRLS